MNKMQRYVTLK